MSVAEKVVLITGGANGIGYAAAWQFLLNGAVVAIADYNKEVGQQARDKLSELSENIYFYEVNVADENSVKTMVTKVLEDLQTIDVLINNAGITRDSLLVKMTEEQFQSVLDVNVKGVFHCTQAVAPTMIAKGKGVIINTSSVSGVYGNVGQTNYAASKAAVVGMTKTWAKELGRKGLNVNAVAPGFIETSMVETIPEKVIEKVKQQVPLKRLGKPEDIAKAYVFLASDDAAYINGAIIHVDGGIVL
ncbi:MAG: beta-ketoacyl-ACP reductase [Bacillaceae bacterium]